MLIDYTSWGWAVKNKLNLGSSYNDIYDEYNNDNDDNVGDDNDGDNDAGNNDDNQVCYQQVLDPCMHNILSGRAEIRL